MYAGNEMKFELVFFPTAVLEIKASSLHNIVLPNHLIVIVFSGMCLKLINVAALINTSLPTFLSTHCIHTLQGSLHSNQSHGEFPSHSNWMTFPP